MGLWPDLLVTKVSSLGRSLYESGPATTSTSRSLVWRSCSFSRSAMHPRRPTFKVSRSSFFLLLRLIFVSLFQTFYKQRHNHMICFFLGTFYFPRQAVFPTWSSYYIGLKTLESHLEFHLSVIWVSLSVVGKLPKSATAATLDGTGIAKKWVPLTLSHKLGRYICI